MTDKMENIKGEVYFEVPFFQGPNSIFDQKNDLNEHELLVYLYLCRCGNNGRSAFPSYGCIGEKCKISRRTAIRAVSGLVEKGFIKKYRSINRSNLYRVYPPASDCESPGSDSQSPIKRTIEKEKEQQQHLPEHSDSQAEKTNARKEYIKRLFSENKIKVWGKTVNHLLLYTDSEIQQIVQFLVDRKQGGRIKNPGGLLSLDPKEICQAILSGELYPQNKQTKPASAFQHEYEIYVPPLI